MYVIVAAWFSWLCDMRFEQQTYIQHCFLFGTHQLALLAAVDRTRRLAAMESKDGKETEAGRWARVLTQGMHAFSNNDAQVAKPLTDLLTAPLARIVIGYLSTNAVNPTRV
jgi:hypothetical protein